jgi:hypothetical protein
VFAHQVLSAPTGGYARACHLGTGPRRRMRCSGPWRQVTVVQPGHRSNPQPLQQRRTHHGSAWVPVWSETPGERYSGIFVAGRRVPDGKRPPAARAIGELCPASPPAIDRQHRQVRTRDQSDEVAGVIVDLDSDPSVSLQPLTQTPSGDWGAPCRPRSPLRRRVVACPLDSGHRTL